MKKIILARMMPLAAGLALFAGCVSAPPPVPAPEAPPPPRAEVVPPQPNMTSGEQSNMEFVWTPGYWDWRGHWVWIKGYWAPPPHPGAIWVQGRWEHRGQGYVWIHPHWQ